MKQAIGKALIHASMFFSVICTTCNYIILFSLGDKAPEMDNVFAGLGIELIEVIFIPFICIATVSTVFLCIGDFTKTTNCTIIALILDTVLIIASIICNGAIYSWGYFLTLVCVVIGTLLIEDKTSY